MDAGIVTLGASQTVATYLIPPLIAPFRRANPQVAALASRHPSSSTLPGSRSALQGGRWASAGSRGTSAVQGCTTLSVAALVPAWTLPYVAPGAGNPHSLSPVCVPPQVTVQMQVDRSRFIADAVVRGELDAGLIGGEVPAEAFQHLQARAQARRPVAQGLTLAVCRAQEQCVDRRSSVSSAAPAVRWALHERSACLQTPWPGLTHSCPPRSCWGCSCHRARALPVCRRADGCSCVGRALVG